ncbi:MAG: Hsp20/alpha crystallin family protein [Desulfobacteraceae bacterium]|nr:MAG: Hsp20/alpha crystallin family protein [Desulfobacteraceae bacterium]
MIVRRIGTWPNWDWRSQFEEIERMRRLLESMSGPMIREPSAGVFPLMNVTEDSDSYYVRAELPGIRTEDLEISVTGNGISISGERKIPDAGTDAVYHRKERDAGRFSRMLSLPGQIDSAKAEADVADGVLTVVLPKSETAKPRQIAIKTA